MKLRTALFAFALLGLPAVALATNPDPSQCGPGQTCKPGCDPATETSVSSCSADFSYVCCKKNEDLNSGQGGCPKSGETCQTGCSAPSADCCAPPSVATNDTCLGGTGICCGAPTPAPSAPGGGGSTTVLKNPLGNVGIFDILNRAIQAFLGIAGSIALLIFVWAGILYMTSRGNEKAVTQAKDMMKYAVYGLALILFAYVLSGYYFRVLIGQ